ncbi:MAG: GGDEF domain-containing protein [Pseudomonadota bacterium]
MRHLTDLLFTTHPHQRIRLVQSGLASLLMLACVLALHYMRLAGLTDGRWLWPWTAFSLIGLLVAFALIRFGWTLHLADPSMTMAQMLYAIACAAAGYMIAGSAHGAVPLILAVVLMFGMFGMSNGQVVFVGAYALVLFGAAMIVMSRVDPQHYPAEVEVAYFLLTAIVIGGVVVLASRLSAMRERLREQRRELQQALARIRELATHDELTGLLNRRRMQELLQEERERSLRAGHPWCVALIDVDHFKQVNDRLGHAAGDEVLRGLAHSGRGQTRKSDVLARWGGEEFVLLLKDAEMDAARAAVERWRQALAAQPLHAAATRVPVRFSAGVAQHAPGESVEQTLARADAALYQAKSRGRDQVVVAPLGTPPVEHAAQ